MRAWRIAALAALLGAVVLSGGCRGLTPTSQRPSPTHGPATSSEAIAARANTQPDDLVDLTVYLRSGSGPGAHLVPVTREVPVADDLPRRALELLLAGPGPDDGRGLAAPVPTSTNVRALRVVGDTAVADLSAEVITDARSVGASPENEALAMAAIANTLTEFPAVDAVRVTVEGRAAGPLEGAGGVDVATFWGGWGLPEVLLRDDSVIGQPPHGDRIPELERFAVEPQAVGADGAPVEITRVRTSPRATYLRVVVELADGADPQAPAGIPPTRAWVDGDRIVVEIADVVSYGAGLAVGQPVQIEDPAFEAVSVEPADLPGAVRIVVRCGTPRAFWLHTLPGPTRILLDVRK